MAERPLGVTVICILGFIGSILGIVVGVSALFLGGMITSMLGPLGALVSVTSAITLLISIVLFVGLYWLWQMLKKGWKLVIVLEGISLILAILYFDILSIGISGIIVAYLWLNKGLFK